MQFFIPTRAVEVRDGYSLDEVFQNLLEGVPASGLFKSSKGFEKFPDARLFTKGHPMLSLLDENIPLMHFEGYYFCAVELDREEHRVLVSIQNLNFRKSDAELEQWLPLFSVLAPETVQITPWFEAMALPKRLLSHPITFAKTRGIASLLL